MSRLCVYMLPLAPDYSGAASALFDMGGIVVMHDASGCTGNFTGYDEPRWLGSRSAVYCSGLRRMDAVLGNDEKFIERTLRAAEDLNPSLIAYLGSPVPTVIGTDLDGIAAEIEAESGIPSFGFATTGLNYYDKGASDVFLRLISRFARKKRMPADLQNSVAEMAEQGAADAQTTTAETTSMKMTDKKSEDEKDGDPKNTASGETRTRVNVLGMLPLDVGNKGNCERILNFLRKEGYEIQADFAMGLGVDDVKNCPDADLNIVIARSGLAAAHYLEEKYGIPYICGIPLGDGKDFSERLHHLQKYPAMPENRSSMEVTESECRTVAETEKKAILIIHEQIFANELRHELEKVTDHPVIVGSLFGLEKELSRTSDVHLKDELSAIEEINSGKYEVIVADPEFQKIIRREDVRLVGVPHVAVSSKLHWEEYPDYLSADITKIIERAVGEEK